MRSVSCIWSFHRAATVRERLPRPVFLALAAVAALSAQQPPSPATGRVIGEVKSIDTAAQRMVVKPDAGGEVQVTLTDKTLYLRVPPGEKDLQKATRIPLADIAVGDRVYARGRLSEDRTTLPATTVIVMTKADLARKHEADRAEWQRRGVAGRVTLLNPQTHEINLAVGPRDAGQTVTVDASGDVRFRRYAPDSVRFADAKPSSFSEVQTGDLVRVLGDKSADGTRVKAEEIVSGSFRNIAAQVKSVDAAANDIRVTDLETKKPLLVHVNPDTMLRRMPPMMAAMIARRREGGGPGGPAGGAPGAAASRPPQAMRQGGSNGPGGPGGPGGAGGGGGVHRGGDLNQAIERMPALTVAELKPGDAIIILSTAGSDPSSVTAMTLVAGVEPLFAASQGAPNLGGGWNLDSSIGMQ